MKVGILTLARVRNWGSFLQAFALKKTVEDRGHQCTFLEIKTSVGVTARPDSLQEAPHMSGLTGKVLRAPRTLLRTARNELRKQSKAGLYQQQFRERYDREFLRLLNIPAAETDLEQEFDRVIIGSDQVFNCLHPSVPWGRTMHLFGEGIRAKRIATYAASFGFTTFDGLEREALTGPVAEALSNVSDLSVRDRNSRDIVQRLTGIVPAIHVDPVLMFDFSTYMPSALSAKNYVVVYSYQQDTFDRETIGAIRQYAKARDKKIVSLYSYHDWCDDCVIAETPLQLLKYFADADSVITSTFHGTVFSIINNRNFVALMKDRNRHRVDFLLSQLGLSERAAEEPEQVIRKLKLGTDYSYCNSVLAAERAKALSYLGTVLKSK